jgi:hypothetical protein
MRTARLKESSLSTSDGDEVGVTSKSVLGQKVEISRGATEDDKHDIFAQPTSIDSKIATWRKAAACRTKLTMDGAAVGNYPLVEAGLRSIIVLDRILARDRDPLVPFTGV